MASASVARPRLVIANRSGLSDSSNTNTQESGSSYALSSARESNLPTGYHHLATTVAVSTPPDVPTPVDPTRRSVAFEHRQGRQALDLTRDKPLPAIPVSSTTHAVRPVAPFLHSISAQLADTLSPRSSWRPLRPRPGSSHSEASLNLYDGDAQTGQNILIQILPPIYPNAGSPVPHLLPITKSSRTPDNHDPIP